MNRFWPVSNLTSPARKSFAIAPGWQPSLAVPLAAIFVEVPSESSDDSTLYDRAARVLKLAANLGATIATQSATDVASALIRYARDHNLSRLVLGRSKKRWFFPWKKTIAQKIGQTADDLDILQVSVSESSLSPFQNRISVSNPTRSSGKIIWPLS